MKFEFGQANERKAIFLILALGLILRFTGLTGFSLSNDELSALARLQFDSLEDVMVQGVYVDFHPPGVQFFLYFWTKIFGFSEWTVRFPFAVMGVFSIYYLYRIGRLWFGVTTGLLAAASLAVLEYPLLYSQIARPYSPGLLFSLMAVYFWSRILFRETTLMSEIKTRWHDYLGFVISISACMYIHYFSFIFAGIICFSGLFFLRKNTMIPYFVSGFFIVLLYLPGLDVFLHHLSKGGLGGADGWLGKPKSDVLITYIDYVFNDSYKLKILYFIILGGTILSFRGQFKITKFHLLTIVFFSLPFAIAYYYSIWKNPVFQYSIMLFSFPFLLLFIFSFIPPERKGTTLAILLAVILTGGVYSSIAEKKYYQTPHFTEFRSIAQRVKSFDLKYGSENVTRVISVFNPYYINYYLEKYEHPVDFKMYTVMSEEQIKEFYSVVESSTTDHFIFAYSNCYIPPEFDVVIRSKFPWKIYDESWFRSGISMYSKNNSDSSLNRLPDFSVNNNFEELLWNNEMQMRDNMVKYEGNYAIHLTDQNEYSPAFSGKLLDLGIQPGSRIEVSAMFLSKIDSLGAMIVFSIDSNDVNYLWKGTGVSGYEKNKGEWFRAFSVLEIPEGIPNAAVLNVYCWNEKKQKLWMDDFRLNVYSPR